MSARSIRRDALAVAANVVPPDPFLFIGEALALDFVNTQIVARGKARDLLGTPEDLTTWWQAAQVHYPDAGLLDTEHQIAFEDPALFAAAQALRGALRGIFSAVADGRAIAADDLAVLNRVLATGYHALALAPDGALRPVFASRDPGPDGALLPIAYAAFTLLTGKDLARLHRCANERCVLLFYDTTKSATRRWCSVACMNRARSSRRYRERKVREAGE